MEDQFFKFSIMSRFPELVHGISKRAYGDMRFGTLAPEKVVENRRQFFQKLGININNVTVAKLAHGIKIFAVSELEKGKGAKELETAIPETDALICREKDIFLMVTGADCLPILLYDPIMRVCGIIHAGWRGIAGQIIPKTIQKMADFGIDGHNLAAGIGPGICQKHFVVKKDVLNIYQDLYPSATLVRNNDGYVDLKRAATFDLTNAGISSNNIQVANECTVCNNGIYGSYRKEGSGAPAFAAVIGIKSEEK